MEAGTGAEVVQIGRRNTAWYSGAPVDPVRLVPGRRATAGADRSARCSTACSLGQEVGEDEIVTLFAARGAEVAAVARGRRRAAASVVGDVGHLRPQPQHQLHERVHVQVPVLRVLEGPAVAEPPRHARTCSTLEEIQGRVARGRRAGRHRGVPAGRHPPRLRRRLLHRRRPGRAGGRARHPRPRLHRARGHRGRASGSASRSRDYLRRLHGRRPARRSPAPRPRSSTTRSGRVLCPDKINTEEWLEAHRTAHSVGLRSNVTIMFGAVEQPAHVGPPHRAHPRPAEGDRRLHRVRAPAVRAHGHADLPAAQGPAGPDLPRGAAHARGRAASPTGAGSTTSRCRG